MTFSTPFQKSTDLLPALAFSSVTCRVCGLCLFFVMCVCLLAHLWRPHCTNQRLRLGDPEPVLFGCVSNLIIRAASLRKAYFRKAPDMSKCLRQVMRATFSVRPKCSHKCASLKESPLKPALILNHATRISAEQTSMRMKWFKLIRIQCLHSMD